MTTDLQLRHSYDVLSRRLALPRLGASVEGPGQADGKLGQIRWSEKTPQDK